MMFHRIVSNLLQYPDAGLHRALPEIAIAIAQDSTLAPGERQTLAAFVEFLVAADPTQAEADYVATFDMVPEHSLHLTHHLLGEDKNRGPALIDLGEFYRQYGFEIADNELPDFLPMILEFASLLEQEEARLFLSRWTKVLRQLAANLEDAGSPYAPLVKLVAARSALADAAAAEPVTAAPRSDPCQADGDFDPPVTWGIGTSGQPSCESAALNPKRASALPLTAHRGLAGGRRAIDRFATDR